MPLSQYLSFLVILLSCPATFAAILSVEVNVEAKKKTTKTGEVGSTSSKTAHYVDRSVLSVSVRSVGGTSDGEVAYYFVARNVQTHALKYCGFEKRAVALAPAPQTIQVESQPVAYSQNKDRDSTRESKRGHVPFGWVVIISAGGQELAVKASAAEILQWVRKYPPRQRTQVSP